MTGRELILAILQLEDIDLPVKIDLFSTAIYLHLNDELSTVQANARAIILTGPERK